MNDQKTWKIIATREDAEEFSDAIGMIGAGWWRQIALGQRLGVPKALGLTTHEWVRERLGGYLKMAIDERRKAVKELAADGHSTRDVAGILGIDNKTAWRDGVANATPAEKNNNENNGAAGDAEANATLEPSPLDAAAAIVADDKVRAAIRPARSATPRKNSARPTLNGR